MNIKNFIQKILHTFFSKDSKRKWIVFLIFFIVSALLWLVNALGKDYELRLPIKAKYINQLPNKALTYSIPDTIYVDVVANGWSLLEYYWLTPNKEIVFDISEFITVGSESKDVKTISHKGFTRILNEGVKIVNVSPGLIRFHFAQVSSKRVLINPEMTLQFAQQFQLKNPIQVSPKFITIYGAKQVLDTIKSVTLEPISATNISESFSTQARFNPISNVMMSDSVVTIQIDVEKYTEEVVKLPIKLINLPSSKKLELLHKTVSVSVFIGISKIESFKESDIIVEADYSKLDAETGDIPLEVRCTSKFATIVFVAPERVAVIEN